MSRTIKSMGGWTTVTHEILYSKEFLKLQQIGGCRQYHQEGNALIHTFLVYLAAQKMFPSDLMMQCVALLHDIGKIYTGKLKPMTTDDWEYPYHSTVGAQHLFTFIPEDLICFDEMQWYIYNHIKPLFWKQKGFNRSQAEFDVSHYGKGNLTKVEVTPERFNNLIDLVICDLQGSIPADYVDTIETINYLRSLKYEE